MSPRKRVLLATLAGLILLPALLLTACHTPENGARAKLDQLLGAAPDDPSTQISPPDDSQQEPSDDLFQSIPDFPDFNGFPGIPLPKAAVDVQETNSAYVLHIPLAAPGDADSVQVQVNPHRIEVSGQTGSQDNGARVSSSFMQSFSTSQEVLPGKVSRHVTQKENQTELTITIPKKYPGSAITPQQNNRPQEHPVEPQSEAPSPMLDHAQGVI